MSLTQQRPRRSAATRRTLPVAGAAVAAIGTLGTIALADSATEADGLAAFDPEFTKDVVAIRTAPLTTLARALTFIGDVPVLIVLILVAAALAYRWTRSWRAPTLLLFAMAGSAALTYGLKAAVERQRPGISYVLGAVDTGFAFPSGHTLNSTVFFGMIAGLLWSGLHFATARVVVATAAVLLSIGIGLSRIYLGYHWATDVLAGWTIAVTWLAIVATVTRLTKWLPQLPSAD
ncbi:phosphatase PAP2 family protein [Kribbella qitaiheensis]|uniref:Phosphatase PAP2 family protein n=1 Tax=Kribbella qitaiheensis TaxID=1544730 RepID=A0A7G6X8V8_9ACTN|nr:phosphatase PAP2 family protein [Kribbella qitaiheensis]QNE22673.1 phosphatase PAP2 family protein [Kribbella qitaiheensis]